jgi:hypothetical protein
MAHLQAAAMHHRKAAAMHHRKAAAMRHRKATTMRHRKATAMRHRKATAMRHRKAGDQKKIGRGMLQKDSQMPVASRLFQGAIGVDTLRSNFSLGLCFLR